MLGSRVGMISKNYDVPGPPLAPNEITNLQVWLDSQDTTTIKNSSGNTVVNNEAVSTWQDKSGNNRHFTSLSGGLSPVYESTSLSGKKCLRFTNDAMSNSYQINTQYFTIVSIFQSGSGGCLWSFARYSGGQNFYPAFGDLFIADSAGNWGTNTGLVDNKIYICFVVYQTNNRVQLFLYDTVELYRKYIDKTFVPNFTFEGGMQLGSHFNGEYVPNAQFAEFVVYNRPLTNTEISSLLSYYKTKYSI